MYRAQYQQQYPISQPRTGLPYGTLPQQHRAQQVVGAAPQSQGQSQVGAAAYLRQQPSTGFPFSSSIQQQQPSSAASLQAAHSNPLAATANGSSLSSAQLVQQLAASNALSSQNDGQLDPNDFPALGPTFHNSGNAPTATQQPNASQSYASQAQQHSANSAALTSNGFTGQGTNAPRDFTNPDEFPALGGQQPHDNHPPGLNGFSTQSSQPNLPPMMQRTILQPDPEKRVRSQREYYPCTRP
jgi:CCR4-NOT transcription complex subunit 2